MDYQADEVARVHGGQTSFASNPGQITVNHIVYYRCYPFYFIVVALAIIVGLTLLAVSLTTAALPVWVGPVVAGVAFVVGIGRTYLNRMIMANGDTCPAVVLEPERNLIAVYADMTTTGETFVPAIKVMRVPLSRSPLSPFKANERLTVVCTFTGEDHAEAWEDVYPIPVVCVTGNQATAGRSLGTISEEHWQAFEEDLAKLKRKRNTGLTFM